ncbi:MAG: hypothetical protein ACK559_13130, partial [bacterium]
VVVRLGVGIEDLGFCLGGRQADRAQQEEGSSQPAGHGIGEAVPSKAQRGHDLLVPAMEG